MRIGAGRGKYENVQGHVISGTERRGVDQLCQFLGQGSTFFFADFMQILHFAGQGSLFFYRVRLISLIPAVFFISESLSLY